MPNRRFRVRILNSQAESIASDMRLGLGRHVIGSSSDCTIRLPYEGVELRHASLTIETNEVTLEDLGGSAGTFLGDTRISGKLPLDLTELATSQGLIGIAGTIWLQLITETGTTALGPSPVAGEEFELPGRYINAELIGEGGQGRVYRAYDTVLDRDVALKVLVDPGNDENRRLLKREVKKSLELTHENIVRVYDYFESPPGIAMELVEGEDLDSRKRKAPGHLFAWEEIEPYILDLCSALRYAHKKGIVHRDIKPQNIFWTKEGVIKLGDFGIAIALADQSGQTTKDAGEMRSFAWCSPQQDAGEPVSKSDDIYSLGATLYDLLTGTPPFFRGYLPIQIRDKTPETMAERLELLHREAIENEATPPPIHPIPEWLEQLVARCLAKNEKDRPRSVSEISRIIKSKGETSGGSMRWPWAAAACAVLAGLWLQFFSSEPPEPLRIITQPQDINASPGQKGAFAVAASGESRSYQWSLKGQDLSGSTNATLTIPNIQYTNEGIYRVIVSSPLGSTNSRAARLSIIRPPPPSISRHPVSIAIPIGGQADFMVIAKGETLSYRWTRDGAPLASKGGGLDPMMYDQNKDGKISRTEVPKQMSRFFDIADKNKDGVLDQNEMKSVGAGAPRGIEGGFGGKGRSRGGQQGNSFSIPNAQAKHSGIYQVEIQNPSGTTKSKKVTLEVIFPPTITSQPDHWTAKSGDAVRLEVGVKGNGKMRFQWRKNGQDIAGETNQIFRIRQVSLEDFADYNVVVSNQAGKLTSETAELIQKKTATPALALPQQTLAKIKQQAENGVEPARWELYRRYYHGVGGAPKDMAQTHQWLEKLSLELIETHARTNSIMAQFEMGSRYFGKQNYEAAKKALHSPAEFGDPEAQFRLGEIKRLGLGGIPKAFTEAVGWHQKAAKTGHAQAQFVLAGMLERGEGIPKDDRKAFDLYKKAADQAMGEAQLKLGQFYEKGIPELNPEKAFMWFQAAATNHLVEAQLQVGRRLEAGNGTVKNLELAAKWFEKTVDQGNAEGEFRLGRMCILGSGVEQDVGRAISLLLRAAKKNYFPAQLEIGKLFYLNRTIKRVAEAEAWLVKASSQKVDSEATLYLASFYLTGANRPANPEKAKQILERIENEQSENAQAALYLLGLIHLKDDFISANRPDAPGYFKKAADMKSVDGLYGALAAYMLGILYKEGNLIFDGLGIKEEKRGGQIHQKKLSEKYFTQALSAIKKSAGNGFPLAQLHMAFAGYTEYWEGIPKDANLKSNQCYKWLILSIDSGLPKQIWGNISWEYTEQQKVGGLALAHDFRRSTNRVAAAPKHPSDIKIVQGTVGLVGLVYGRFSNLRIRRKCARDLAEGVLAAGYISPKP